MIVVGVDPGPTPGICGLLYQDGKLSAARVLQINAPGCLGAVSWLLGSCWGNGHSALLAVERFVIGRRSVVSGSRDAGQITRDMIGALGGLVAGEEGRVTFVSRSAAEVKPWAIDERLKAVGLLSSCLGMPHAKDAVKHALFAAVADLGVADPLSRRSVGAVTATGVSG